MPPPLVCRRIAGAAVSHVESFALAADEMAGVFQRKFQTSCSVTKLPGKEEKDHEIMMQVLRDCTDCAFHLTN
jgi:hypothetical protein